MFDIDCILTRPTDDDLPENCVPITEGLIARTIEALRRRAVFFTQFCFPLVRQVFPTLIANDIVSVQPMTAPSGAIFFMDYKYDKFLDPSYVWNPADKTDFDK